MSALLIRNARQLLTLRGRPEPRRGAEMRELGIIEHGSVLVRDGSIKAVGSGLPERGAREIDATGKVVMPGFVDSHTHLVFGEPRLRDYEMQLAGAGYADIAAAGGGILWSVERVRAMPEPELAVQARTAVAAMMRHGTTTVEAKSGYGLDEEGELKMLRVATAAGAVPTYLGAHVPPPEFATADAYVDWICARMLRSVTGLARFADVYCDGNAFTLEQARRYLRAAADHGLRLKVHAEQFTRTGAAEMAVEMGAVSADHLEQAGEREIAALADSDTMATLLPGSVWHLGLERYAPARRLIDSGVAVALATDFNPGTSPTYNMQMVISLACRMMGMTPAEAISAATINGAHALGMSRRTGSLEPGKQADIVIMNVSDYREIPYYFGTNNVAVTIRQGVEIA